MQLSPVFERWEAFHDPHSPSRNSRLRAVSSRRQQRWSLGCCDSRLSHGFGSAQIVLVDKFIRCRLGLVAALKANYFGSGLVSIFEVGGELVVERLECRDASHGRIFSFEEPRRQARKSNVNNTRSLLLVHRQGKLRFECRLLFDEGLGDWVRQATIDTNAARNPRRMHSQLFSLAYDCCDLKCIPQDSNRESSLERHESEVDIIQERKQLFHPARNGVVLRRRVGATKTHLARDSRRGSRPTLGIFAPDPGNHTVHLERLRQLNRCK